jgi:PAS domain S-box-containing protein
LQSGARRGTTICIAREGSEGRAGTQAQRPGARHGTNKGGVTLQWSSDLSAGRTREDSDQMMEERQPNPSLGKVAWYAGVITSVALLALLLRDLFGTSASVDVGALHSALTMVALGVSLAIVVTGWNSVGGRIRPDTTALIRAFTGIAVLGTVCLVFTSLSQSGIRSDTAFCGMLHSGMGLTIAAGMLAASYLPRGTAELSRIERWIAFAPGVAVAAVLALSYSAGLAPIAPQTLLVGTTAAIALFLYAWAGLRMVQRFKRDREDDLVYLLAAIVTGMLAESMLSVADGSPQLRHLLGDLYRVAAFLLAYAALFHRVAHDPYLELHRAQAALRTERERLARDRQIVKLASWEWDARTDAVWTSEQARQVFGIPADKISMTRADFENLIYHDDRERVRAAAHAALAQDAAYSIDYRILSPDGSPRTLHNEAQVERDAAGKPLRMAGIVQDITDRVAVEHVLRENTAQIRSMNTELENRVELRTRQLAAASKELEAFSYSVSHDLQAPLRRIERYAELLAENNGARLDDTGRDMLRRIQEASSQTKQLISDILKLSRVSRTALHCVAVDLSAMAQRVVDQIERAASPARQVEVSIEPGLILEADAAMLQILLDNLLGNAWKFTSRTEKPSIRIGAIEPTEGKGFYIEDNGAGFDMRYAHKLFGAFQRLHGQDEFKGTGIGLAIVQRIVNVHGWQIDAQSEIGRGATFTIRAH